jgi:hypothetical protein
MRSMTIGEAALVAFLFALVWGAGVLPRLGERIGAQLVRKGRKPGGGPE